MIAQLKVLSLLCLSVIVQPVALSSSVQEGEEEALKLWQKFCAGTTDQDKTSNSGGLFVFCSPTPLNDDVPEVDLRLNHDIKVSPEEKLIQTEVEVPKTTISAEIPKAHHVPHQRNRTRGRGGRRRLYYARKNTVEQPSKDGEQFTRDLPSDSKDSSESSTQSISTTTTTTPPQIEPQADSEVNQKNSTVSLLRRGQNKDRRGGAGRRPGHRSAGRRRVAVVDVKPVSLFVSNETATATTEPNGNSSS